MDQDQKKFIRSLLHQVMNSAISATIWRLPRPVLLGLVGVIILALWYFKLY
jgi:hypothetical protein